MDESKLIGVESRASTDGGQARVITTRQMAAEEVILNRTICIIMVDVVGLVNDDFSMSNDEGFSCCWGSIGSGRYHTIEVESEQVRIRPVEMARL